MSPASVSAFIVGFALCWVRFIAVNSTTEAKGRRQAPIDHAYRVGYFNGWAEAHKALGAAVPEAVAPPTEAPSRRWWSRRA